MNIINSEIKPYGYLEGADLIEANLQGANLRNTMYETDIPIIINTEYYLIVKCQQYIKIGCKQYTVTQWEKFTDKEIDNMGTNALVFWNKYKSLVLS